MARGLGVARFAKNFGLSSLLLLTSQLVGQSADELFEVTEFSLGNRTQGVELEPWIQIRVNQKFDAKTVNDKAVELVQVGGDSIAINIGGDLGGVITLSVEEPLQLDTEYELRVTASLKSLTGAFLEADKIRFRTTDQAPPPPHWRLICHTKSGSSNFLSMCKNSAQKQIR